jgi:methylated-DNA-[protein]-cysteine S-methyltransferase
MAEAATLEAADEVAAAGPTGGGPSTKAVVPRHAVVTTSVGELTLVAAGQALVGVYFHQHRPEPDRTKFGEPVEPGDDEVLAAAAEQLAAYVDGRRTTFDLPLQPAGSERARQTWDLVAAVPRGETITYAALGRAVGVGPRAAGQYVARNPLCVVVPCHRVVASGGRLTGYAGGVDRKRKLLELEGALAPGAATASPASAPAAAEEADA